RDQTVRPGDERAAIIAELHDLYSKALGPQEPSIEPLVEAVRDAAAAEEAEGMSAGGVEPYSEFFAQGEQFSQEIDAAEGGEEFCSTAAPQPARYTTQRVTPAGHFPPKFRRVPAH